MFVINVRNVHEALPVALDFILNADQSTAQESRFGDVLKCKWPVTTHYSNPTERVIFWPERDANPYFHFMESLWMMAGRKDTKWITQFNASFQQFSDNGKDFHGAYGHRWRSHFMRDGKAMDQIMMIGNMLRENKLDRRAVLQMWDGPIDLALEGKDFPCNTQIYFSASEGQLDMTVCCRSNDIVWGAYGANAVHMSVLQEVVAGIVGIPVGHYWQISNNWHGYTKTFEPIKDLASADISRNPYEDMSPFPIMNVPADVWFSDLDIFMTEGPITGFRDRFFRRVVTPMFHSWAAWKNKEDTERWDKAIEIVQHCAADDWRIACTDWLHRRNPNVAPSK